MIRCTLAVAAESIVVDGATNVASALNIIEEIQAPGFPGVLPKVMILFLLERDSNDPEQPEGYTMVVTLAGQNLFSAPVDVNFQGKLRLRLMTGLTGVIFPGPGQLVFSLRAGATIVGRWEITVGQLGGPQLLPLQAQTTTATEPVQPPTA